MMDELKPCPFCGGEAYLESVFDWVCVECNGCKVSTKAYEDPKEAEEVWNRRVGDDLIERMVDDGK